MARSLLSICAQLCAACLLSSAAAADVEALAKRNWIKVDSQNFSIVTEQDEEVARQVVADLETFRYFRMRFGTMKTLDVSKRLPILAVGDDAFAELGFPETWAGMFSLSLNGYSAVTNIGGYRHGSKTDNWARTVLLHEYFHFLLRLSEQTLAYPPWVDEGMADYWATFNVDGDAIRLGDRVTSSGGGSRDYGMYNNSGRLSVDTEKTFNTVALRLDGGKRADEDELSRFYSSAYFATHYFNSTEALRASLGKYIALINRGYRQDRAAALAFKKTYAELNKDIRKYLTVHLAARVLTAQNGKFDIPKVSATITRLETPGLYLQLARILPEHEISSTGLGKLLARNRELNPNDGEANVLPLLHGLEHNSAAELEQRFPTHPKLLAWRADQLRRQAEYMKDLGETDWLPVAYKARNYYRKAITIDAGYPSPYNGLGLLYRLLPASEPLEEAVAGFDTASIYTRDPATFRQLAGVFLRMGKPMEALGALRGAVAFSKPALLGPEALLLDNIELLSELAGVAKATETGLEYGSGTAYAGGVSNGKPEGEGRITLPNGSYYEGPFLQGLPHGKGKLVSDTGQVYQGEFERGYGRGQGEVHYPAGSESISYKGRMEYMRPSGQGVLVTRSGRYVGSFEDGSMHGAGAFTAANKPVTLSGTWRRGGIEWAAADGVVFTGPANADGLRHGSGTCRGADAREIPAPCKFKDGQLRPGEG